MIDETVKGGLYLDKAGNWVNAEGKPVDVDKLSNADRVKVGLKQKRPGKKTEGQEAAK